MTGGFRSDLSITCMIDGNFGNVFASHVSTKTVVIMRNCNIERGASEEAGRTRVVHLVVMNYHKGKEIVFFFF